MAKTYCKSFSEDWAKVDVIIGMNSRATQLKFCNTHLITIMAASQMHVMVNKSACRLQPVNCINLHKYIALLCEPTVCSLYIDVMPFKEHATCWINNTVYLHIHVFKYKFPFFAAKFSNIN